MKRVAIVLIAVLMLTGCNPTVAQPIFTPSEPTLIPTIQPTTIVNAQEGELPAEYYNNPGLAIAPIPRSIKITNYELGANFEFLVYLHNSDGLLAKLIKITTEPGETIAAIPINATLANNGLLDIVSLQSTLPDEKLEAIAYDSTTKLLTIKGFIPSTERILRVVYRTTTTLKLSYALPPKIHQGFSPAPEIFKTFVEFDRTVITLKPLESVTIPVKVAIPPKWVSPNNLIEFEILAEEVNLTTASVGVSKAVAQPVLITLE